MLTEVTLLLSSANREVGNLEEIAAPLMGVP